MGSTIPRKVVLNCIRKEAECKPACGPTSRQHPPWFLLYSCEVCSLARGNAVEISKQDLGLSDE